MMCGKVMLALCCSVVIADTQYKVMLPGAAKCTDGTQVCGTSVFSQVDTFISIGRLLWQPFTYWIEEVDH
jgi:hypothetical protein